MTHHATYVNKVTGCLQSKKGEVDYESIADDVTNTHAHL